MLAHICRRASAPSERGIAHFVQAPMLAGLCLAGLLAGCSGAPPAPITGVHPASPDVSTRPTAYRGVIGPYVSQRPRDPSAWRENNERVAPQEKP
jgi:hypothetical protein